VDLESVVLKRVNLKSASEGQLGCVLMSLCRGCMKGIPLPTIGLERAARRPAGEGCFLIAGGERRAPIGGGRWRGGRWRHWSGEQYAVVY
jgi:hypothetical protein